MSDCVENLPLKPYSRSVSIIGVGATPFMLTSEDPETQGLGEGEMFGTAAIAAMKDAGVSPKEIEYYFHGQALPGAQSKYITPNAQMGNWFGMRGKASSHHSEACCTGYVALEQAVMAVASGTYDMVLSGCCDMSYSTATLGKPSHIRETLGNEEFAVNGLGWLYDKSYAQPSYGANPLVCDSWMDMYRRENGLSVEQVDDVLCQLSIDCRRASSKNPRGVMRKTFEEEAAELGMTADEYVRSMYNPIMTRYMRISNFEQRCDGAAAVIVCPTELAYKYTDHPIEVLGYGHSVLDGFTANLEKYATEAAYKQVKELTGLSGADMDLFLTNDFFMPSQLLSAEACEYLPKGEGWKYILESRTAFDGDMPMNTSGGRCHYGHAHGTSGLADVFEAVMQLRGEMGETQIKGDPRYAMLRGFGGGQNVTVSILKKL